MTTDAGTLRCIEIALDDIVQYMRFIEQDLLELDKTNTDMVELIESIDSNFNTVLVHIAAAKNKITKTRESKSGE